MKLRQRVTICCCLFLQMSDLGGDIEQAGVKAEFGKWVDVEAPPSWCFILMITMYARLTGWRLWWEWKGIYWMPHFVFYFGIRPKQYKVSIRLKDKDIKYLRCDPHKDAFGVLIQKRDIFYFCLLYPLTGCSFYLKQEIKAEESHGLVDSK